MIRIITLTIILISGIHSQDRQRLGESELKRASRVDFINRESFKADRSTANRQTEIGRNLAIKLSSSQGKTIKDSGFTIKRIPGSESPKFGADLITITNQANYGHINSLIRIFAGYIGEAFDYSPRDSEIISKYLIYYNALHRNEKSYFRDKYAPSVVESLDVESVGLGKSYRDWAGSSQLILPLEVSPTSRKLEIPLMEMEREVEKLNSETKVIQDGEKKRIIEIIKENKKEEDKIVKIEKEKRLEEKINNNPEKKTIPPVEKKDPEKSEPNPTTKKETREEKVSSPSSTDTQTIKPSDTKIPEEQKKIESPPTGSKSEQASLNEPKKEEPRPAETKEKDPQVEKLIKENEDLKAKEKEREVKSENVIGDKILFLRLVKYEDDGHYTNELWMIDAKNEETVYRSPYSNICGKEFHVLPKGGVVVIGFDGNRPTERIHRLVLLDPDKLSQKSVSKNEIFYRSHLMVREDKIYAFEKVKDQIFFTRFNPDMSMDARSSEPVGTNSEVTFFNDKIFLTGRGSEQEETVIRVMQKSDLKITKTIKPLERKR